MKSLLSKLILLMLPLFIFLIWLVIHNQNKVNHTIKKQTTVFNKQFTGFNGGGQASPPAPARPNKIANNQELNKKINGSLGNF